jgi:hypothetical protein
MVRGLCGGVQHRRGACRCLLHVAGLALEGRGAPFGVVLAVVAIGGGLLLSVLGGCLCGIAVPAG